MADSTKPSTTTSTTDDKAADDAALSKSAPEPTKEETSPAGGLKADPGPVTDALEGHAPLPDPIEHRDQVRNDDDAQASSAIAAEENPEVNTNPVHLGYQVSQFDESGGTSVLNSLAYPPPGAVEAERVAQARISPKYDELEGTNVSPPVTDEDDHDLKEANESDLTKTGTNQEQVIRSDGSKTTDTATK